MRSRAVGRWWRSAVAVGWLAALLVAGISGVQAKPQPQGPGAQTRPHDGDAAFEAALAMMQRGSPMQAVLAMLEAEDLARTLPWQADGRWKAPEAIAKLRQVMGGRGRGPVGRAKKTRGLEPWVAGEFALGLARTANALADPGQSPRLHAAAAGCVDAGAILGPLEGPVPQAPPAASATVRGKHGPTGFRAFSQAAHPDGLPIADWLPSEGDAHVWLGFDLDVKVAIDATFVLGSNGPLEARLDDTHVLASFANERAAADWQHASTWRLEPGRHRLLVGVGHSTVAPALFLRIVDARGLAFSDQELAVGPLTDGQGAATATPVARPTLVELAANDTERAAFLVARPRAPALDREAARLLAPDGNAPCIDAWTCYLLGRAEYPADAGRARLAFERAADFGHAPALAALVDIAESRGLLADADRFARRLAEMAPHHPALMAHRALRLLELADGRGVAEALRQLPQTPVNPRLATLLATSLEQQRSVLAAARAWAVAARLQYHASEPLRRAVALYRQAGAESEAMELLGAAGDARHHAVDVRLLTARLLVPHAEPKEIIAKWLDSAVAFHPQHPALPAIAGRLALLAGDTSAAIAAFDRALELSPQDRDLADHRRSLVAERSAGDAFFLDRSEVVKAARGVKPASEGAIFVVDRQRVRVFDNGLASTFRQVAIRIDHDRAAERHAEQVLAFTPGEDRIEVIEAEVLRADGSRLRPDSVTEHRQDGKEGGVYTLTAFRVVRFPALKAGDILHLQTRKDEIGARNIFGDFFGALAPLSAEIPKAHVEFVVDAPATRPLYHFQHQADAPAADTSVPGRTILRWEMRNLPAIPVEPNMPGYGDVGAWVNVSTFASWEAMIAWYRNLIRPQLELPGELKELAAKLAKDAVATLDAEAMGRRAWVITEAIHRWVVTSTRYVGIEFGIHGFKPWHVGEVVRRGYGDCKDKAALLVAMLREVGIAAEFVLVRTRDYGRLADSPATLWTFNHAIAWVPDIGFIDGTAELSGLGELPELDQGAQMLRFDPWADTPPVTGSIPMQSAVENTVTSQTAWDLAPNGDAVAILTETLEGSNAAKIRYMMQDPSRRLGQLHQILTSQHAGTELVSGTFENLETIGRPVVIRVEARLPGLARREADVLTVPLVLSPGRRLRELGSLQSRRQPLVLTLLEREISSENWALPTGARIETLPAPVRLETPFGIYVLKVSTPSGRVQVDSTFEPRVERVAPSDYPAFRAFLEAIARAEAAVFTVRLAAP